MIGIYRYTNLINGKRYIGQSIDIEKRYKDHLNRKCSLIDKAIDKYGIENFRFEVLEFCEPEQLNELETYWITYYNTNIYTGGYGYNRNNGGDGHGGRAWNKGIPCSEDQKEKQKQKMLGKPGPNKGKKMTEESKEKNRLSHLGMPAWNKGIPCSEEQKEKQKQKMQGKEPWNKGKKGLQIPWNKGLKKNMINN